MDKELHGYIDWICKAEEAILKEEKTTELERRHIMESMSAFKKKYYQILILLRCFFFTSFSREVKKRCFGEKKIYQL
jgi:hypothetical protein